MTFGQRLGLEPTKIPFQIEEMNELLRIDIWNACYMYIFEVIEDSRYDLSELGSITWMYFFQ